MEITKALIPAAGLATRFLPYTKAVPKAMLPLLHKPALQLILEECVRSLVKEVLLVADPAHALINDFLNPKSSLHLLLRERGQDVKNLEEVDRLVNKLCIHKIPQPEPLGLGHAIWLARALIKQDEYFAVCLPDDIIVDRQPGIAQLMEIAYHEQATVIAVQEVPSPLLSSYGVIGIKKQLSSHLFDVSHIVEKPHLKDAPSQLAVVGRYVLSPAVFTAMEAMSSYAHEELQLTPALSHLITLDERVIAYKIQGSRYDIGTPLGWLKAVLALGWRDPVYGAALKGYLTELEEQSVLTHQRKREGGDIL